MKEHYSYLRKEPRFMQRLYRGLLTLLLGGLFAITPVATETAAASIEFLNCTGWGHISYSPPLTNTPTLTTVTADDRTGNQVLPSDPLGTCVSSSTIAGGIEQGSVNRVTSCQTFTAPGAESGTQTITWVHLNSSTSFSTASYDRGVVRVNGNTIVTNTGTVTAGDFVNKSFVETLIAPNTAFDACSTSGISELTFQIQITIV